MFRISCVLLLTLVPATFADDAADAKTREDNFAAMLSKSALIGSFTIDGKNDQVPKAERYEIDKVEKVGDDQWMFTARIKYGSTDVTLPIQVPVKWAGDTPMVSLTDVVIPGMGSGFSARVLFYDNRYAGTWQHGKIGGHMFGRIEKQKSKGDKPSTPDNSADQKSDGKS